jgi:hypothetical protein
MSDNDTEINTVIHNDPEINPGQYHADSEKLTSAFDQDLSDESINKKVDSYELWNNKHAQAVKYLSTVRAKEKQHSFEKRALTMSSLSSQNTQHFQK